MHKKRFAIYFIIIVLIIAALVLLYFQTFLDTFKIIILSIVVVVVIIGLLVLWHFVGAPNRLRVLLKELETGLLRESPGALKERYVHAYELYLALSEKKKQNFYGRIVRLREKMEEQMKAEKKVEELLEPQKVHDIRQLQKTYDEMQRSYRLLTPKSQEKYYVQMMHMKDKLERGR